MMSNIKVFLIFILILKVGNVQAEINMSESHSPDYNQKTITYTNTNTKAWCKRKESYNPSTSAVTLEYSCSDGGDQKTAQKKYANFEDAYNDQEVRKAPQKVY